MRYCPDCMRAVDVEETCPRCGTKRLRGILSQDPVYLARLNFAESAMLAQMLSEQEIPCLRRGVSGAARTQMSAVSDSYDLFVPYGALARARELLAVLRQPQTDADTAEEAEAEE